MGRRRPPRPQAEQRSPAILLSPSDRISASPPTIQREMYAISGVDPVWPLDVPGAPSGYAWLDNAEREYQVCLKCHSTFTTLPAYRPDGWNGTAYTADGLWKLDRSTTIQIADSRNLAQEFNPNNASYHPVAAVGRNQSIPSASFVNGWTQSSLTYCSDCHANASASTQGAGPHGSPASPRWHGQFWGGPKLTQSPLMKFKIVQEASYEHSGNSANALRAILSRAIEQTRPEGERRFTGEWILYNILEMKFLEGYKVRDIVTRLAMSEADLYRKQRVAIDAVATAIAEMELKAKSESIHESDVAIGVNQE